MKGEAERRGFRITGRVQGVGFRWWSCRTASALGVRGSVRNRTDGSVEIHAAGPPEVLDRFAEKLQTGPPSARVEGVRRASSDLPIPDADFRVER